MTSQVRLSAIRVIDDANTIIRYHELLRMAAEQYNKFHNPKEQEKVQILLEAYMSEIDPIIDELEKKLEVLNFVSENLSEPSKSAVEEPVT